GREGALSVVLEGLAGILQEQQAAIKEQAKFAQTQKRQGTLFRTACEYLNLGQKKLALAFFLRLIEEFQITAYIYEQICLQFQNFDCAEETRIFSEALLKKEPNFIEPYRYVYNAFLESGCYAKAEKVLQDSVRKFGTHPMMYLRFAKLYLLWEKFNDAREMAEAALAKDPTLGEAQKILDMLSEEDF
ncbi:MAG: hypothetical protein IK079_04570, partial [Desulfovibrio sp.]|nr:hypothetical protein [Desulfovibrio sp.]